MNKKRLSVMTQSRQINRSGWACKPGSFDTQSASRLFDADTLGIPIPSAWIDHPQ
jgi:hypothetical protein